ncbi:hypothetical protein MTR67_026454 [Solanum verrucosum]|uniref:Uncharacterized protein n=1 Tax=Solanum verrucosum TaxID=315347 RepID=A0AAF0TUT9_SOLVR|nr:hypothetical protein MTR67_026454 [Solanum verrucosum]
MLVIAMTGKALQAMLLCSGPVLFHGRLRSNQLSLCLLQKPSLLLRLLVRQAIWLRRLLEELKFKQEEATKIFCGNDLAIQLSKNPVLHGRSKHIDVKFYFLRDLSNNGTIDLIYCRREDQVADIFTKALKTESFMKLRRLLGVCTIKDVN